MGNIGRCGPEGYGFYFARLDLDCDSVFYSGVALGILDKDLYFHINITKSVALIEC